jgi:hypothetical protein
LLAASVEAAAASKTERARLSHRGKRSTETAESIADIAEAASRSGEVAVDVGGLKPASRRMRRS